MGLVKLNSSYKKIKLDSHLILHYSESKMDHHQHVMGKMLKVKGSIKGMPMTLNRKGVSIQSLGGTAFSIYQVSKNLKSVKISITHIPWTNMK